MRRRRPDADLSQGIPLDQHADGKLRVVIIKTDMTAPICDAGSSAKAGIACAFMSPRPACHSRVAKREPEMRRRSGSRRRFSSLLCAKNSSFASPSGHAACAVWQREV
jgi:hypothetical protein